MIHCVTFISIEYFAVSSLISSYLDIAAGELLDTVCTWTVSSFSDMLSVASSGCFHEYTKLIHTSLNQVTFSAIVVEYFIRVSSLMLPMVYDHYVLSPYIILPPYIGEIFDTQTLLLTSFCISLLCCCRDFDVCPVGLSSYSRTTPIPDLLASTWILTGFYTS